MTSHIHSLSRAYFFDRESGDAEGDYVYQSAAWTHIFGRFVRSGYMPEYGGAWEVTAGASGMTSDVASGAAWLRGYFAQRTPAAGAVTLTHNDSDADFDRIDRIVIRWDLADRDIRLEIKHGTAASDPSPPARQDSDNVLELVFADVTVPAGATSADQFTYTDQRGDETLCPPARGLPGLTQLGEAGVLEYEPILQRTDERTTEFDYDTDGNVTEQRDKASGSTIRTTTFTYDAAGDVTEIAEDVEGLTITTTFTYDGDGNVTSETRSVTETT